MKKKIYAILLGALIVTLCGCSQNKPSAMYIKPSVFSEETTEVLNLFDDEIQFFDIAVDETVQSYAISIWVCRNGEWVENGMTVGNMDHLTGRIAVRITETSCDIYTIDGLMRMVMRSIVSRLRIFHLTNQPESAEQELASRPLSN